MGHIHNVHDTDARFIVDPITRKIKDGSNKKVTLIQFDHNSERLSFEIPKIIEGHDMSQCNKVEIHYFNVAEQENKKNSGVYTVDDLQVDPKNPEVVVCSWLISISATKLNGLLKFLIRYRCVDENDVETYAWNTAFFTGISVSEGSDAAESFETEYVDIIEQWKASVLEGFNDDISAWKLKAETQINTDLSRWKTNTEKGLSDWKNQAETDLEDWKETNVDEVHHVMGDYETYMNKKHEELKARMDTFTSLEEGSTTGDAELQDIRVGANGKTYESAGSAVREQFEKVNSDIDCIKMVIQPELEIGSVDQGIEVDMTARARITEPIKYWNAKIYISYLDGYYFGYTVFDALGNYDGVDHGWNTMAQDREIVLDGEGSVTMNFMRFDAAEMTEEDLTIISSAIRIEYIDVLHQLEEIREELGAGFTVYEDFAIEVGSIAGGEPVDSMSNRARLTEKIPMNEKVIFTLAKNSDYFYGYAVYDENGIYDGIDNGWNHLINNIEFYYENPCYIRLNFMRKDNGEITDEDIATLTSLIKITAREDENSVVKTVRKLQKTTDAVCKDIDELKLLNAMASIIVEYGRKNGASYVFVRIPKTANDGKTFVPRVSLTSEDRSIEGTKLSPLNFAKKNNTVFVINAGLFNMTTMQPVGQTIIDGVSVLDEPMESDNGVPISDIECYPLCIDSEGNLSAHYDRNIDTDTMLEDGIVQAVTGWGKLVEDFKICQEDIDAEIVHQGLYIRQSIGQFENGDYCVCTVEQSRNSVHNEAGLTYTDLAEIFVDKGAMFAYSLDGGGSSGTVIGKRQLNRIYEGTTGRPVPTVICFELK